MMANPSFSYLFLHLFALQLQVFVLFNKGHIYVFQSNNDSAIHWKRQGNWRQQHTFDTCKTSNASKHLDMKIHHHHEERKDMRKALKQLNN